MALRDANPASLTRFVNSSCFTNSAHSQTRRSKRVSLRPIRKAVRQKYVESAAVRLVCTRAHEFSNVTKSAVEIAELGALEGMELPTEQSTCRPSAAEVLFRSTDALWSDQRVYISYALLGSRYFCNPTLILAGRSVLVELARRTPALPKICVVLRSTGVWTWLAGPVAEVTGSTCCWADE